MCRWVSLWIVFIHCAGSVAAQLSHMQAGSVYVTSGAYGKNFMDAFSFLSNPACLGNTHYIMGGCLGERKWMLPELGSYELAIVLPVFRGGMGLALQQSGDAAFHEQAIQLAYGKNLGRLEAGIHFNILHSQAEGYRGLNFLNAGIGLRFQVNDKIISGWEMDLPVASFPGKAPLETPPQIFSMGIGYEPGPEWLLVFQLEKISGVPVNIFPSIEYCYAGQFLFSIGIYSSNGALYFKSGWNKNRISIQIYSLYEPLLGFTPGLVFLWNAENRQP
jgi:hypothetical protein